MKKVVATQWLARGRSISLDVKPLMMGIVNLTPDSFSERPLFAKPVADTQSPRDVSPERDDNSEAFQVDENAVVDYALTLVRDGAAILDLGAESTSPGSLPVSPEEQLRRLLPSVKRLALVTHCPISIDTTSSIVARHTLDAGAMIINDISGGTFDPEMIDVVRHYEAGVCVGHIQGTPRTMQTAPRYDNVVAEIREHLASRRDEFMKHGVPSQAIALDPGIGFGKTQEHNNEIVLRADEFRTGDSVLLFGHSRKRFLRAFCRQFLGTDEASDSDVHPGSSNPPNDNSNELDVLTALVSEFLARKGVDVLRVHRIEHGFGAIPVDRSL